PPPNLCIPLERCHETEADRFEDRIDEIPNAPALQFLEAGFERLERAAKVRHDDHTRAGGQIARGLDVRAVHAQHELGPGVHRGADLDGVERVHTDAHAGRHELTDNVAE